MSITRRRLLVALAVAAALLLAARLGATLYAEHAWYAAVDADAIWRARVVNSMLLHGTTWFAGTAFAFANLYAVRSSVLRFALPRRVADLDIAAEIPGRMLVLVAALVAAGIGALLTFVQGDWTTLALFRYLAGSAVDRDPYFEGDVAGFWMGWLPLERAWYTWAQATLIAVSCLVIVLYALTSSLRWERGSLHVNTHVRRHISVLGALLLLLLAWGYRIERFLLLVNGGRDGVEGFVGYTDVRVTLTALLVLSLLTAACALLVCWAGFTGQTRLAFGGVTAVIVLAITLQQIVPAAARWMSRGVPEPRRVWPYRATQASFTQRAYGLDTTLTVSDPPPGFTALDSMAGRVSVWDPLMLLASAERQSRRRVPVGGLGWRAAPSGIEALVTLRDVESDSLGGEGSWALAFLAAGQGGGVGGGPRVAVRPLPPVRIWPGAPGYATVPAAAGEVAAPVLGDGWRRLAFALSTQNLRLFIDRGNRPTARLLLRRELRERIERVAPVFVQGAQVTPVFARDSLYWAVPLYSSARTYPLSVPLSLDGEATKFFHHAGTALVPAHSGRVLIVPAARLDPLAQAWFRRFPQPLQGARALPPAILTQLPPPGESARVRVLAFSRVGTRSESPLPLDFAEPPGSDTLLAAPIPVPRLAADQPVTVLDYPLVRRQDERVAAIATITGGARPRLVIQALPTPGPAWPDVVARLQRAAATLPAPSDGAPLRGAIRTVPVSGGSAFIQPVFGQAFDAAPTLAGVVLQHGDSILGGTTLRAALGLAEVAVTGAPDGLAGALPEEDPAALYRQMEEALRRADWEAFGAAFRALGRALGLPGDR